MGTPQTTIAVILSSDTYQLKEISYVTTPTSYLPIRENQARSLVAEKLMDMGYSDIDPDLLQTTFVHRTLSPFELEVEGKAPSEGLTFYVTQDGIIH